MTLFGAQNARDSVICGLIKQANLDLDFHPFPQKAQRGDNSWRKTKVPKVSFLFKSKIRMPKISALCVFCGVSAGASPTYIQHAQALGKLMAERKIKLVYGGGSMGLMGALGRSVADAGGDVLGIMPHALHGTPPIRA